MVCASHAEKSPRRPSIVEFWLPLAVEYQGRKTAIASSNPPTQAMISPRWSFSKCTGRAYTAGGLHAAQRAGRLARVLRRLDPDPAEVTPLEVLAPLRPGERAPAGRPYLLANMVASADGRATVAGKSGGLSNEADRELFHGLREQVDGVMVGTGTLRVERYGAFIRDPERRKRREAAGLDPVPWGCIVTRTMVLPDDIPLFADPDSRIAIYTSSDADPPEVAAHLEVVRLPTGSLTMTAALEQLRADHGVRSVLCEGGPTVLGALLAEGIVDELFLSVAPQLAGGHGPGTVEGPALPEPAELERAWTLESDGMLFLRYVIRR